ncbi:N-acetylglucosamine-6-phosphate deacetylase [Anaerotaenia torta]|uniref:N-acetylglucosamine-6-phosphate deacetylase n=1 Tax=Anaerotaenia torta TaxID=433293 RepID=UPI003D1ED4CB
MIIKNAEVFYKGKFEKKDVRTKGGLIFAVEESLSGDEVGEVIDGSGLFLLPGFIDIHTHGRAGLDFSTAIADEFGMLYQSYAECGVTSVLATTMTVEYETTKRIMGRSGAAIESGLYGSRILGINLEGPFLGPDRKGCHDDRHLLVPAIDLVDELDELSGENIRLLDIDPTLPNAMDCIRKYSKKKTVSIAHTSSDYETACAAVQAGAAHVTHLFNAMNSLHHREPGVIGMAADYPVTAELICDGIHVHSAVIRMMFRLMGERIALISDSMSTAGLGEGEYELGGLKVFVKEKKASLADGTIAGSTTNVFEAVKNVIRFGVEKEKAILSASLIPARAIGVDRMVGKIAEGKKADLLLVTPEFDLEQVYIGGKRFK